MDKTIRKYNLSREMFLNIFLQQERLKATSGRCLEIKEHCRSNSNQFVTYESVQSYIDSCLESFEAKSLKINESIQENIKHDYWCSYGRLGPRRVMFDVMSNVGSLNIDFDRVSISSHSGFSSIKANVGIMMGKWMYEVMLGTKGVMQIGWATRKCRFSQEKGVGDTVDSYAFDGNRIRKWNNTTSRYGESWIAGDVIGVTIDLDSGTIDFYRNGKHLGEAFSNVRIGPGMVYFPSVSLAYAEEIQVNFGSTPYRYPVSGYQPLELFSSVENDKAELLIDWLCNLAIIDLPNQNPKISIGLVGNMILQKLSPLLVQKYIIENCLVNKLKTFKSNQDIHKLLDLLWALLEINQMKDILDFLVLSIVNGYRYSTISGVIKNSNSASPTSHNNSSFFTPQKQYLMLFLSLVQHPKTRSYLLKQVIFDKIKFPHLLFVRPVLDNEVLERYLFPDITVSRLLKSPTEAMKVLKSSDIESAIAEIESLHQMIIDTLIFQDEICRIIFISKFDGFIKENSSYHGSLRFGVGGMSGSQTTPLSVILCFFHRLTSLIRIQYENMINVLPVSFFVDSSCVSSDVTRIGGVVSHLNKICEKKMSDYCETAAGMNPLLKHVYILIDGLIKLYAIGAHKQLGKHCSVRENVNEYAEAVLEINKFSIDITDARETHNNTISVLEKDFLYHARQLAWINSTVLTSSKSADIYWLLKLLLSTLQHGSSSGSLFGFIPDYYIESCLHLCYAMRFYFKSAQNCGKANFNYCPTVTSEQQDEYKDLLTQFATFISQHFGDDRIVNADLRDNIAQALASLVSNPETLKFLEQVETESKQKMIKSLTAPYENRAWAQSNWILLRMWKGNGFGYRYTVPPNMVNRIGSPHANKDLLSALNYLQPCPSDYLIGQICEYLSSNRSVSNTFITSILSQLNWSFSEFIGMLQEIQNAANKPDQRTFIDTRQLKVCCTCFDLTLALLRVLEMVVTVNSCLITDTQRNDMILSQTCSLINQILNRVTAQTNSFQFVCDLDVPGLEPVAHFPILTAVAGILISLTLRGDPNSREAAINAFVSDASFLPSSILYMTGRADSISGKSTPHNVFNLCDYENEITREEVDLLNQTTILLTAKYHKMEGSKHVEIISDDDICTICYANRKTAVFVPCGHRSCKSCISMHFLRHQECFFCKSNLEKVTFSDSKDVIYPKTTKFQ